VARNLELSNTTSRIMKAGMSLALSCLASQVFASGFQIQEQNVTNLGLAYSGTASLAEDASTGYFNAAGLTRMDNAQIVIAGVLITGSFDFTADSAISSIGSPMGGGDADPGTTVAFPTLHLAKRIDERWVFGFNITSPFGLTTRYSDESIARYLATESELGSLNFSPSLAYQLSQTFSVGFGGDAEYLFANLAAKFGPGIEQFEGYQRNHANGWGYGWHVGFLWEPTDCTRIGINYRSKVNVHAEGDSENQTVLGYSIARVRTKVVLPETATLSLFHQFNQKFAFTADVAWTDWSRFHTLRLRFARPLQASFVNPINNIDMPIIAVDTDTFENYKDARRYALGLIYTQDDCWKFRFGVAYDETPVRDEYRTARLPDSDRIWLALGAAYTMNKCWQFDFGYAHLFFKDANINEAAPFVAFTEQPVSAAHLTGSFNSNANILGIQMRYNFV